MRYLSKFLWTHSSDVDTLVPNNSEFLSWNSNISVLPGLNLLNFYTIVSLVGHLLRPLCRMQNKGKAKIILEFFLMLMFMITVSGLNYLYNHSESARVVRENLLTLRSRHIKKCKDSHSINNDPYKEYLDFRGNTLRHANGDFDESVHYSINKTRGLRSWPPENQKVTRSEVSKLRPAHRNSKVNM